MQPRVKLPFSSLRLKARVFPPANSVLTAFSGDFRPVCFSNAAICALSLAICLSFFADKALSVGAYDGRPVGDDVSLVGLAVGHRVGKVGAGVLFWYAGR
jgi:hypothetical protein